MCPFEMRFYTSEITTGSISHIVAASSYLSKSTASQNAIMTSYLYVLSSTDSFRSSNDFSSYSLSELNKYFSRSLRRVSISILKHNSSQTVIKMTKFSSRALTLARKGCPSPICRMISCYGHCTGAMCRQHNRESCTIAGGISFCYCSVS